MRQRKWAAIFSILLFIASLASLVYNGLHLGIDFTGGTQIVVHFPVKTNPDTVREKVVNAGFPQAMVMTYGKLKHQPN